MVKKTKNNNIKAIINGKCFCNKNYFKRKKDKYFCNKTNTSKNTTKMPLKAKKSLGQNFLHDNEIVKNICKNALIKDNVIIEVGAGTGFLTQEIIKNEPKFSKYCFISR